jgi:hypothetical protein
MLDQSDDLKMIFEAGFIPRLKDRADDYGDFSEPQQRWYFLRDLQREEATSQTVAFEKFENLTAEEAELSIRNAAPTDYRGAVDALYSAASRKENKSRWGEKMPRYVLHISWLASTFPDSHIVHIIRDPRDVAESIRRAGWQNLRDAAESWKERVAVGREEGRQVEEGRYHEVKYEELLNKPKKTLESLASKIKINFSKRMLRVESSSGSTIPESHLEAHDGLFNNINKPIDKSRSQSWKREMTEREVSEIESVAAPVMKKVGYKLSGAKVPFWVRGVRWMGSIAETVIYNIKSRIKKL